MGVFGREAEQAATSQWHPAQEVARGGTYVFGARVVGRLIRFLLQVVLGRVLGPAAYGAYAVIYATIDLAKVVASLGLDRGALRYVAVLSSADPLSASRVQGLALLSAAAAGVVVAVGLLLSAGWLVDVLALVPFGALFAVAAVGVPVLTVSFVASGAMRGWRKVGLDALLQEIVQPVVHLGIFALLALIGLTAIASAVTGLALSHLVVAGLTISALVWMHRHQRLQQERVFTTREPQIWRYSLSMLFVSLGSLALLRMDKLFLGAQVAVADVGLYAAAAMIAQQNKFVLQALNTAFAPQVAKLHHERRIDELGSLLKGLNYWTVVATLPMLLVSVLFSREFLGLMGPAFTPAAPLLVILVAGQFFASATGCVGVVLNMSGNQRFELWNSGGAMAMLAMGILFLVPSYGVRGAALAVATTIALRNLARVVQVKRIFGFHPFELRLLRPIACGLAAAFGGVVFAGSVELPALWRLLAGVVVVTSCYGALVWTMALDTGARGRLIAIVLRRM